MVNLSSEYKSKFEQLRQQNSKLSKEIENIGGLVTDYRHREVSFMKEIDKASKI